MNSINMRLKDKPVLMTNSKITLIVFGFWIGLLLSASVIMELFLQDQVYSYRTFMVVVILSVTGVLSSAVSWWFFSPFGRSTYATSIILCLANIILFLIIGILVSYITLEAIPDILKPAQEAGHDSFEDIIKEIVTGALGAGFSFKTFGLPLLWPFGVISGITGTFIFVHINKMMNSRVPH